MKYEIQYYYSASNNSTGYCKEAHGDNMPSDCVPVTDEMWQIYEDGVKQGLVMQPAKNGFVMVHPDTLLTEQERIERDKQIQINHANTLLNQSIKLESGVYQRRMSTDEKTEFRIWQDELLAFIDGNSETMPQIPEFIQVLL